MKKLLIPLAVLSAAFSACSDPDHVADYNVIPLPHEIVLSGDKGFVLNEKTVIAYPAENGLLAGTASLLAEYIEVSTGLRLETGTRPGIRNSITLSSGLADPNSEAYRLSVQPRGILIEGASEAGAFYGAQTLRKSLPVAVDGEVLSEIYMPAVVIDDFPRFGYRGMHLDIGRHMFPVEFIKEYLDIMALHNINTFHWHLTEDQGWRIEIRKYPRLTEVGSERKETLVGSNRDRPRVYDGKPYGGYYTQDEVREVVAYAAERYIEVIPEVDLPGHMLAAMTAYPELGCTRGPYEVATHWGVFDDVLCPGRENTFDFIEGVFTEIMELFPSEYVHIGGDECPKVRWKACPDCQKRIRQLGLKGDGEHSAEEKLQSYTISRVEKFLNDNGRRVIGWDEILEGGVAPNATVMSWRGTAGGIKATQLGHDVIMTPNIFLYFDYPQGEPGNPQEPFIGHRPKVTVGTVYGYEPYADELTGEQRAHIKGVQANMWTEYLPAPENVEYMLMPRIDALSEVQWVSEGRKDYDAFLVRLRRMAALYDKFGYNYARHAFVE